MRIASVAAAFFAVALMAIAAKPEHTNVIVIMADDIGFECYGCYGSEYYKTPNIDKLAAEGARFTHAYSQPLCTPSRVKIMTGKHNFRNYVTFGLLDLSQKTFAHAVKEVGYKTCVAGKWQLSPGNAEGPFQAGFDEYMLWHLELNGEKKGNRFKSPLIFRDGKKVEGTEGKYGPDIATDFICEFIGNNKAEPFVVYYPMILVHNPFDPTPDSVDWTEKKSKREPLDRFGDMVTYMDKVIGQIVAKLEAEGLRENTLIMVTGDNGTNTGITSPWPTRGGKIDGGKGKMIDDGTHVAFVASWPGTIKPGTVVESPIEFSDVFPTVAEVAGAPVPEDLDGQSMVPLLKGDESNARGWAFVDYSRSGTPPYRHFIRTPRYKLYSTGELYDVPNDWMEKNPLTSPETEGVRKKLQSAMDKVMQGHPTEEEILKRLGGTRKMNAKAERDLKKSGRKKRNKKNTSIPIGRGNLTTEPQRLGGDGVNLRRLPLRCQRGRWPIAFQSAPGKESRSNFRHRCVGRRTGVCRRRWNPSPLPPQMGCSRKSEIGNQTRSEMNKQG